MKCRWYASWRETPVLHTVHVGTRVFLSVVLYVRIINIYVFVNPVAPASPAAAAAAAVTSGPPPTARAPIRTTQSMDNEAPTIHASTISRMAYGDHRAKEIEITLSRKGLSGYRDER